MSLCPIKVNSSTIELTIHTSCYSVLTYSMLILMLFCYKKVLTFVYQPCFSQVKKANNALSNRKELLDLLTTYYFSRLHYNSEIWLLSTLNVRNKQQLLLASTKAIKCVMYNPDPSISFIKIHEMNNRATTEMFTL